jgi:hypothetical protein
MKASYNSKGPLLSIPTLAEIQCRRESIRLLESWVMEGGVCHVCPPFAFIHICNAKGRALLSTQALAQFQLRGQSTREWAIYRWLILPGSSSQGISSCMPEEGIH